MEICKMAGSSKTIVVISGCSSGIGLETAVLLAKDKNFKVIATMRNLQKKDDLEKAAGESLNKSLFIQELDISKEESILKFLKETYATEGRIDILRILSQNYLVAAAPHEDFMSANFKRLVNNAAVMQGGHFEYVTLEGMQALFQTNVFGTVRITQEVVKKMKEQKSGHIIFISSILGVYPVPFSEFYVASKFALEGLAGCIAPILRGFNIRVTTIEPGPVDTPLKENVMKNNQGSFEPEEDPMLDSKVDEETHAMRLAYWENCMLPLIQTGMQSGQEVAEVIKRCIDEKEPHVRIQTSEMTEKMAKEVLIDPTGDKAVEYMTSIMIKK